jgi:release factor glutamine methyltransferase
MSDSGEAWTVRRVLEWTTAFFERKMVDSPRLSAELLLAHVLGAARIKLYTDYERPLTPQQLAQYRQLVQRAGEHEPIAYLIGKAHFFNLELDIEPGVLIPRPDTETLVEQVVQLCRHQPGLEAPRILELCTGSGCIAAALATSLKAAVIYATDISPAAVALARRNLQKLGLMDRVTVEEGDLFAPLERAVDVRPFDLIVANPPYIPTGQIDSLDRGVRQYEPLAALDGGLDGLSFHRRILEQAPRRLAAGGRLYLEIAFDQGPAAVALATAHGQYTQTRLIKDYGGHERVLTMCLAG